MKIQYIPSQALNVRLELLNLSTKMLTEFLHISEQRDFQTKQNYNCHYSSKFFMLQANPVANPLQFQRKAINIIYNYLILTSNYFM